MFRLIYRQRRRLLFSSFFITLVIMMLVGLSHGGFAPFADNIAIYLATITLTALIVAAGTFTAAALFVLALPAWRTMVEVGTVSIFLSTMIPLIWPGAKDVPVIGGFLPFICTMIVFSLLYGEVSDRFRIRVDHPEQRRFVSPKSRTELWTELVPHPDHMAAHWDPLLCALDPDPADPGSFEAKYSHGGSLFEHQTMTMLETTALERAKYHHIGDVNPKNRSLLEGTYEVEMAQLPSGRGTRVTLRSHRHEMLLREALLRWFDDDLGDRTDHLRSAHHNRRDWSMTGRYRRKVIKFA